MFLHHHLIHNQDIGKSPIREALLPVTFPQCVWYYVITFTGKSKSYNNLDSDTDKLRPWVLNGFGGRNYCMSFTHVSIQNLQNLKHINHGQWII